MSLRINLLRGDELRQAGVLSQAFVFRLITGVVVAVLAVAITVMMVHVSSAKQNMAAARARFRQIDPVWQDIRAMQTNLQGNRKLLDELETWKVSRANWHQSLQDLQSVVPPAIQLTKLNLRGAIEMIEEPAWKEIPPIPSRVFSLRLDGRVVGRLADAVVGGFLRDVRTSPALQPLFQTVRMQRGIQRDASSGGDREMWTFGMEGVGKPLRMEIPKKEQELPQS